MSEETMKMVFIRRSPNGHDGGLIPLNEIWNIHWDCITGGIAGQLPYMFLMGLISYETACESDVKFSGEHHYENGIKVCIIRKYTPKDTWKCLVERYGPSPEWGARKGRTPCTTRILQILEEMPEHYMQRKELRNRLSSEFYSAQSFCSGIKKMRSDRRIYTEGSNNSPYQLIGLPVPELPLKGLNVCVEYRCKQTGPLSCDATKTSFVYETEACSRAEGQLTMSVAQKIQARLETLGAKVVCQIMSEGATARFDYTQAESSIPIDMHVRICADASDDVSLCGITVYVPDVYGDTGENRVAGEYVLNAVTAAAGAKSNGVGVIAMGYKFVYCPTLQVSLGYMSNPDEAVLMETEEYQQKLAQGICEGLVQYLTEGVKKKRR